ncbi:hypothetical protein protein [Babesia ovis]|uniref:Uncharacterized protein n=1 Tax=Babesia ovis TaxID=5869 RepID=A0A9W5T7M3_BABOV|nr:hypothetical protein protein [Babesia ovis]
MKLNLVLWRRRPIGGGPVPLLRNPVKRWLHLLIFLHLFLLILTCIAISFPFIYDLHCSILFNSLANIIASSVGSFVLAAYYTGIAAKDWGTEVEWTLTTLITATMVVVDIAVSAWGIYALSNASVKIYQALHNALELEPECLQTKAAIFYFAAFAVIFAHLIVAGMCAVVSVLLGKGIKRQDAVTFHSVGGVDIHAPKVISEPAGTDDTADSMTIMQTYPHVKTRDVERLPHLLYGINHRLGHLEYAVDIGNGLLFRRDLDGRLTHSDIGITNGA